MSAVRTVPPLMTSKVALAMLYARLSRLWAIRQLMQHFITECWETGMEKGHVPEMSEHHGRGEDHSRGIGTVRAHDVLSDVPAARLEESVFLDIDVFSFSPNRRI